MYEIIGDKVTLKFALKTDMRRIYEMMIAEEVGDFMFDEDHLAPSWDAFFLQEQHYFPEMASRDGSYLLIYYEGCLAGTVKYTCGYEKMPYAELSMWLAGYEFMGKGIGCDAVSLIRSYVHEAYGINEFIVRAWTRNLSAIQTYNKCGFHESASFDIANYYGEEELRRIGKSVYGPQETLNLYCNIMGEMVI